MKIITLTQSKSTVVDDEDFDELSKYKWYAIRNGRTFYAGRKINTEKGRRILFMHNCILSTTKETTVDHVDCDGLNNQKSNLRLAVGGQNNMNRRTPRNNTSGFKGVSFRKDIKRWAARIRIEKVDLHLGFYDTPQEAHSAYQEAATQHHGSFARFS